MRTAGPGRGRAGPPGEICARPVRGWKRAPGEDGCRSDRSALSRPASARTSGMTMAGRYHWRKAQSAKAMARARKSTPRRDRVRPAFGEVDEQGAAAAQVEEKDVQPLKVIQGGRKQVVEKTAGQGRGHHDQQQGFQFPAHEADSPVGFPGSGLPRRCRRVLVQVGMAEACSRIAAACRWRPGSRPVILPRPSGRRGICSRTAGTGGSRGRPMTRARVRMSSALVTGWGAAMLTGPTSVSQVRAWRMAPTMSLMPIQLMYWSPAAEAGGEAPAPRWRAAG